MEPCLEFLIGLLREGEKKRLSLPHWLPEGAAFLLRVLY